MRHIVTLGLVAAVLAAGALALRSVPALATAVQVWRGYYTLLVHEENSTAEDPGATLVGALVEADVGAVVSAYTASERVTIFAGYEWVALADLDLRLDALDPRYDPYLRRVANWFTTAADTGAAQVVYVASALPPAYFAARVAWELSGSGVSWQMVELPRGRVLLGLLLFAVSGALQIYPRDSRVPRWWRVAQALPWLSVIVHGGLLAALVAVPAYCGGIRLVGTLRRGGWRAAATAVAALLGIGLLSLIVLAGRAGDGLPLFRALPAGTVQPMALYLVVGFVWHAAMSCICLPAWCLAPALPPALPPAPQQRAAWVASSLMFVLLGVAVLLTAARGESIPRPHPVPGSVGLSLANLQTLGSDGATELPVLSHYVAHAAYQETLQFGRPYALPKPDERVSVDQYRRGQDARVLHETEQVAYFSEQWLRATLAAAPHTGVAALLLAQGRAVAARRESPVPFTARQTVVWMVAILLVAAAMLWRAPLVRRVPRPPVPATAGADDPMRG